MNRPVDFVVTWVDENDPGWRADRDRAGKEPGAFFDQRGNERERFRDWGLFRYWFRAVEKYAPWVNTVYLVTSGHAPEWLDKDAPKLRLIKHEDFIPKEYLPTFNCNAIELNLHRIPGLSEHFVYFNDDVYLNRPSKPEDYFVNGLPNLTPAAGHLLYIDSEPSVHMILETIGLINRLYKGKLKSIMTENKDKWFSEKTKGSEKANLEAAERNFLMGFYIPHLCVPLRKSTMEKTWEMAPQILMRTCRGSFRGPMDIVVYLFALIEMMEGQFNPVEPGFYGKPFMNVKESLDEVITAVFRSNYRQICINDAPGISDDEFAYITGELAAAFKAVMAEPSSFELTVNS